MQCIYILFIDMLVVLSRHVNVYYLWFDCWSGSLIPLFFYYMINVLLWYDSIGVKFMVLLVMFLFFEVFVAFLFYLVLLWFILLFYSLLFLLFAYHVLYMIRWRCLFYGIGSG